MKSMFFFLISLISVTAISQNSDWIQQSPPPTDKTLQSVEIISPGIIIAVGDNGTIIKSVDGGVTWKKIYSGTSSRLYDVDFTDVNIGYIAGGSGIILKSTDGGETWTKLVSGTSNSLYSVKFINANTGWISGYNRMVLKTTNGGNSWEIQFSTSILTYLEDLEVISEQKIVSVGWGSQGNFYKSIDGGSNWSGSNLGTAWAKAVQFENELKGWVTGVTASYISVTSDPFMGTTITVNGKKATIWKTEDGGENWNPYIFNIGLWLYDITLVNNNPYAVGDNGLILFTPDNGTTWIDNSIPEYSEIAFNSVKFESNTTGYIVGENGTILKTKDGGVTWNSLGSNGTTNHLYSTFFINDTIGWVVGYNGTIVKTHNAGTTWSKVNSGTNSTLNSVFFSDLNNGWCVGSYGLILNSADGGDNWSQQTSGVSNELNSVHFSDSNHGWAVGSSGVILHTTNGGATWTGQNSGTSQNLVSVVFINNSVGWIACNSSTILKTVNGGQSWQPINIAEKESYKTIYDLFFTDELNGWCIGNWIMKTTDGGESWVKQFDDMDYYDYGYFNKLYFINPQSGWIAAGNGKILKTENGGSTWGISSTGLYTSFNDLIFVNSQTGWLAGYNGYILKTTNGGGNYIEMESVGVPNPIEPENYQWGTSGNPLLRWSSAGDNVNYQIRISIETENYYDSIVSELNNISDTVVVLENLLPDTRYYWQVCAEGESGVTGNWSQKFQFTTGSVPQCIPNLYDPWEFIYGENLNVKLQWSCWDGYEFRVQVSTDILFTTLIANSIVNQTSFEVDLEYEHTYYWRVMPLFGSYEGNWSDSEIFISPEKPVVIDPFINVTSPSFGASYTYNESVYIYWDDNIYETLLILLYKGNELVDTLGYTDNSYQTNFTWSIEESLPEGENYKIVVKDVVSEISDESGFFSILSPFINIIHPDGVIDIVTGSIGIFIFWEDNSLNNLCILLFNNGVFVDTIGYADYQDYFSWDVPLTIQEGENYTIVVKDLITGISGTSNKFSIVKPNLYIWEPNTITNWHQGESNVQIFWDYNLMENQNLLILLYKNGIIVDTIGYVSSGLSYSHYYNVPVSLISGSDYQVVFKDTLLSLIYYSEYFTISNETGADIVNSNTFAEVYPNPTAEIIIVELNKDYINGCFIFYDITGRILIKNTLKQTKNIIHVGQFPRGIYFIQINYGSIIKNVKIILK